jgi:methylamine utilization protein MauE
VSIAALGAKAALAVVLLIAGGAKLADLDGFGAAIRLFLPDRLPPLALTALPLVAAVIAAVIAAGELLIGLVSLCWPALGWVNVAVLALACGFTAVAAVGFARHRGQACRCFGALTRRGFGPSTLAQALVITGAAWLAAQPARAPQLQIGLSAHLLLLAGAGITGLAGYAAARALAPGRTWPGMAG